MRRGLGASLLLLALASAGCSGGVETTYGRARGRSVNGTGALAELLRIEGHTVRVATHLNDEVANWADTILRFAPYPGPPDRKEADWYRDWLDAAPGRRLLYVPRDFDAESEYWSEVLARLPQDAPAKLREGAQRRRDETKSWAGHLPPRAKDPAPAEVWFAVAEASGPPILCKTLSGEWAAGIDPAAAAVTRHQTLKADNEEHVLLEGDGRVLAMEWWWDEPTTRVLVLANGSFLLNEPLLHRARRPLALRVVRWIGPAPRQIVFVESRSPTEAQAEEMPSPFALLGIDPFGWIAAHLGVFALLACLAASVRLGRPRPAPAPGSDRPAAHAEAIGDLLARTRDAAAARALLDAYRRWRHPPSPAPAARARRH